MGRNDSRSRSRSPAQKRRSRSRSPDDRRGRSPPPRGGKDYGRRSDSRKGGKRGYGGKDSYGKGKGKGKGKNSSLSVLVRNLDFSSSPADVKDHFSQCGNIRDVYLPLEYGSKKPKGFGFIEFLDAEDAYYAVRKMDGSRLHGATLNVMIAQDRRKSPHTMERRDAEEPRKGGKGSRKDSRARGRGRSHSR